MTYRVGLGWASITTLAGSLCSVWLAHALLTTFTGAGLVTADIAAQTGFALTAALAAAITIVIATWRRLPVSTTHALLGVMVGAGWVAVGTNLHFASLGQVFLLPLLVSSIIAIVPALFIAPLLRRWVAGHQRRRAECVCIEHNVLVTPEGLMSRESHALRAGMLAECVDRVDRDEPTLARIRGFGVVDACGWVVTLPIGAVFGALICAWVR